MGTRITRVMGFLPVNFSILCLSILDLGSGTGQTDRQRSSTLNAPPYGSEGMRKTFAKYASQVEIFFFCRCPTEDGVRLCRSWRGWQCVNWRLYEQLGSE